MLEYGATDYSSSFANLIGNYQFPAVVSTLDATANVSEFGNKIKVRVNFQRKSELGFDQNNLLGVSPITEPKFYQEFFVKVDKALFIKNEGLE